jgi:hypothetical protein
VVNTIAPPHHIRPIERNSFHIRHFELNYFLFTHFRFGGLRQRDMNVFWPSRDGHQNTHMVRAGVRQPPKYHKVPWARRWALPSSNSRSFRFRIPGPLLFVGDISRVIIIRQKRAPRSSDVNVYEFPFTHSTIASTSRATARPSRYVRETCGANGKISTAGVWPVAGTWTQTRYTPGICHAHNRQSRSGLYIGLSRSARFDPAPSPWRRPYF